VLENMGNNRSKPIKKSVSKKVQRFINLVNTNDKFFSDNLIKKKGSFRITRINLWKKNKADIWFYAPPDYDESYPYNVNWFHVGRIQSFDEEKLIVTIAFGYDLYAVPLWKVFMKQYSGPPLRSMWAIRKDIVQLGDTNTASDFDDSQYNLKF